MDNTNAVMIITTNTISMGTLIVNNLIDTIDQAKLNILVKDIIRLHRDREINAAYDNLAKEFHNSLVAGPDEFIRATRGELDTINNGGRINTFLDLRNRCPIIAYVLTGDIKVLGKFGSCQPTGGRIYATYVAAVQALDDII